MSLLDRLFVGSSPSRPRLEPTLPVRAQITDPRELSLAIGALRGGGLSASGVTVTPATAERLAAVAACIRVLADAIAHLPLHLYRRDGRRRRLAREEPLYRILKQTPNGWQTSFDFRRLMQRDLLLCGNAYALKVTGGGGRILELQRLHPSRVTPEQDRDSLEVTYLVTQESGGQVRLPQAAMLHLRGPSDDGVVGLSPMRLHRETIGFGLALKEHGAAFFRQGAQPGALLTPKSKLTKEDREDLRSDFEGLYSGVRNAHRVAILMPDMDFKALSISMEDQQYLETMKLNRSEIAGIFGVPSYKINDLEKATFSNIEQQSIDFVQSSLMPWLVMWEQGLELALLAPGSDMYVKHEADALLRGTAKERAEALRLQRLSGALSANEWREMEDRDPRDDPGGDAFIVEGNTRPGDGSASAEPASQPERES